MTVGTLGRAARLLVCAAALGVSGLACGGGSDAPTKPTPVPPVRSLTLTPANATLTVGDGPLQLVAAVDADPGANTAVQYRSSNLGAVSVTSTGLVTGLAPGSAVITASSVASPTVQATSTIVVRPVPPQIKRIVLSNSSAELFVGTTFDIGVRAEGDFGADLNVTWATSNPAVATVAEVHPGSIGRIRAIGPGTATITITSVATPSVSASLVVTVRPRLHRITLAAPAVDVFLPFAGGTASSTLRYTVEADSGANTAVTATSADERIATVQALAGVLTVTGVSLGRTTITLVSVADPTKRATAEVVVFRQPPQIRQITLTPAAPELFAGTRIDVQSSAAGDPGADPRVTWTTSNPAVATVETSSTAGRVTGVAPGTATITATSLASPSVSASVTVTVRQPRVTNIVLSRTTLSVIIGTPGTIVARPTGDPGAFTGLGRVTSSDTTIATVVQRDTLVTVTGHRVGTATLVFPTTNPNVGATATVTVRPPPLVRSITPFPSEVTLFVSQTTIVGVGIQGDEGADTGIKGFASSDTTVAVVGFGGTTGGRVGIGGRSPGTATVFIYTANPEVVGTVRVTVIAPQVRTISVDSTSVTARLPASGGTSIVTVGYRLTGDPGASPAIVITSSNAEVATAVVGNGVVTITAKSPGTSTITLTSETNPSVSARIDVTVVRASP